MSRRRVGRKQKARFSRPERFVFLRYSASSASPSCTTLIQNLDQRSSSSASASSYGRSPGSPTSSSRIVVDFARTQPRLRKSKANRSSPTLAVGRRTMRWRSTRICKDRRELSKLSSVEAARTAGRGEVDPTGRVTPTPSRAVAVANLRTKKPMRMDVRAAGPCESEASVVFGQK